jgi:hypothetical protein
LGPPLVHPDNVMVVAFRPDGRTFLTGCRGQAASWRMTDPAPGTVAELCRWVEAVVGVEMDELGIERVLEAPGWERRRRP